MPCKTNIQKIDVHAHANAFGDFYPLHTDGNPNSRFVTAEQVISFYDKLGIEKGVLLPIASPEGQPSPMPSESCKYLADKYPDRFVWFCNVDPRAFPNQKDGDLARLIRYYKNLGAKGVGEITALLDANDPKVMNLFAACEECDMPALIHIATSYDFGYGIYDELGLPRIENILKTFPNLKLIGHSQAFWAEISGDLTEELRGEYPEGKVVEGGALVRLMRTYPNLYCDLSAGSGANAMMRDEEFAVKFLEEFSDRILYGCDICHSDNTHPFRFRDFLDKLVEEGKLSEETYRKIARENAIRILKLED